MFHFILSLVYKIVKNHRDLLYLIVLDRFPLSRPWFFNMNNRKSPNKQQQQRMRNSHPIPVVSNSKNSNYRHYSNTNSPTAMSASSLPAVPMFYSNTYADPPDCSSLPKPPESWYLKPNDENRPVEIVEEKEKSNPKRKSNYKNNNNRGFYSPFYSSRAQTPYISIKA